MQLTNFYDDFPQMNDQELYSMKDGFEWYYFDIEDENNGISLVVIFKKKNSMIHKENPAIYIEFKKGNRREKYIKIYNKDQFSFSNTEKEAILKIAQNELIITKAEDNSIEKYLINVDLGKFKVSLNYTPLHAGYKSSENGIYFQNIHNKKLYTAVNFAAPRINGIGTLNLFGELFNLEGDGYHDHPWGTSTLLHTNAEWHWGRICNDNYTIMYADVKPHKDYVGSQRYIYFGEVGNKIPEILTDFEIIPSNWSKENSKMKFPRKITLISNKLGLETNMQFLELFNDEPIYNRSIVNYKISKIHNNSVNINGHSWTEYFVVSKLFRNLIYMINKFKLKKVIKYTNSIL